MSIKTQAGLVAAVIIATWAVGSNSAFGQSVVISPKAEIILGVRVKDNQVEFSVRSTGCTKKGDFKIERIETGRSTVAQIQLIRTGPDYCKMVTHRTTIRFSYEELGLQEGQLLIVANLFATHEVPDFGR